MNQTIKTQGVTPEYIESLYRKYGLLPKAGAMDIDAAGRCCAMGVLAVEQGCAGDFPINFAIAFDKGFLGSSWGDRGAFYAAGQHMRKLMDDLESGKRTDRW